MIRVVQLDTTCARLILSNMMSDITNNTTSTNAPVDCPVPAATATATATSTTTEQVEPLPAAVADFKAPEECRCGDIFNAEYHRAAKIGEGAYGAITAVYDDDGNSFALKTFEENEEDGSIDIGTLREMSILRLLREDLAHTGIIQAHDFYISEIDSAVCMVMPKAVGSLEDVLQGSIKLDKGSRVRVTHQFLSALTFLHDNGVMHRDIKPDNILLNSANEPILCDFSLAKFVSDVYEGVTHSGDVGTAVYMAPEVTCGETWWFLFGSMC